MGGSCGAMCCGKGDTKGILELSLAYGLFIFDLIYPPPPPPYDPHPSVAAS